MNILYILHADFETPGIISTWAKKHRFQESFCRPFANEKVSDSFDMLVLMGGPQSPLEIEKDPYLKDEIDLVKKALQREIPILGFCLGAQIIGEALGAKTERSPFKEVGVYPIHLTPDGKQDPLLKSLPSPLLVSHWHNDMPGLTNESKVLSYSDGCPRQIVRYLPGVYGFQCHPEITKQNMETMIHHCPQDLTPGKFVQSSSQLLSHDFASINNHMIQILDNLLIGVRCNIC